MGARPLVFQSAMRQPARLSDAQPTGTSSSSRLSRPCCRWLEHASEKPADIYVVGLQEAVKLNAKNAVDPRKGGVGKQVT